VSILARSSLSLEEKILERIFAADEESSRPFLLKRKDPPKDLSLEERILERIS
jgi:hypothetical protein